jgi:hypothetical protein
MITSTMKQDMQQNLGYGAEQIKKMTPQQASLVLYHQVLPENYEEQLPLLEEEFEKEQEQQRQKEKEEQDKLSKMAAARASLSPDNATASPESLSIHTAFLSQGQQGYQYTDPSSSSEILHAGMFGLEDGFLDTWYEVVEIRPNGEAIRQGLYQNEEEAELGLQTREMIRDRQREKDRHQDRNEVIFSRQYSTFEIRQISKDEIFQQG